MPKGEMKNFLVYLGYYLDSFNDDDVELYENDPYLVNISTNEKNYGSNKELIIARQKHYSNGQ